MKVLLLTHAFNSLAQRLFVELEAAGYEVSVEFDISDAVTREAVALFDPDVLIAPFLKRAIPEDVTRSVKCLIVHPGPVGDRGPSSLDWAILDGAETWGVTVLAAAAEFDAGDVWATRTFPLRPATKGSLYRHEVTDGAVEGVFEALDKMARGIAPVVQGPGRFRPSMTQADRRIDWTADDTETVLRKIRSGDGFPGVRDEMFGKPVSLFDAHPEPDLRGDPGAVIARKLGAVCRATKDGAVWIGHLRDWAQEQPIKLPAATVLEEFLDGVPEAGAYEDIRTEYSEGVAYLHFPFHNGAMAPEQCDRLRRDFRDIEAQVIVLMGGPDFWSNGIHLNRIEAADSPADDSWRAINAIDDLARDIVTRTDAVLISALNGNAGAGGVFLALAADFVWARRGVILNPHYKGMGNLYGSEYWTYLLPKRTGPEKAREIAAARLPMGTDEALRFGLLDDAFRKFDRQVRYRASAIAAGPELADILAEKKAVRAADEAIKPLDSYRQEELARMKLNFYGFDPSYHVARYNFVNRVPKSRTPLTIARHRRRVGGVGSADADSRAMGAGGTS